MTHIFFKKYQTDYSWSPLIIIVDSELNASVSFGDNKIHVEDWKHPDYPFCGALKWYRSEYHYEEIT